MKWPDTPLLYALSLLLTVALAAGGISTARASSFDYLPTSADCQPVEHSHYTLCYSEAHEQAAWVAYELTKDEVPASRKADRQFSPGPSSYDGVSRIH